VRSAINNRTPHRRPHSRHRRAQRARQNNRLQTAHDVLFDESPHLSINEARVPEPVAERELDGAGGGGRREEVVLARVADLQLNKDTHTPRNDEVRRATTREMEVRSGDDSHRDRCDSCRVVHARWQRSYARVFKDTAGEISSSLSHRSLAQTKARSSSS